jgi:hypothetical protein
MKTKEERELARAAKRRVQTLKRILRDLGPLGGELHQTGAGDCFSVWWHAGGRVNDVPLEEAARVVREEAEGIRTLREWGSS